MKILYFKLALVGILLCCFSNSFAQVTISGFSPRFGAPGTPVIISGGGFNSTPANNVVYFGDHLATVNTASANSLTVTIPKGASYNRITVINTGTKLQATSSLFFNPIFLSNGVFDANSFINVPQTVLSYSNYTTAFEVLDLNNDKYTDAVATGYFYDSLLIASNITTNTSANPSFNATITSIPNVPLSGASAIAKGDLDGDGKFDLVVANPGNATISVYRNTTSNVISSTSFDPPFTLSGTSGITNIYIEDMNSDGKPEILYNNGSYPIYIIQNTFSGSNISAASFLNPVFIDVNVEKFNIADFNNDGRPDVVLYSSSSVGIVENIIPANGVINSVSSFGTPSFYYPGVYYSDIACGDLDNDGRIDFAVTDYYSYSVHIFQNNTTVPSNITFSSSTIYGSISDPRMISISDLDGDGRPDFTVSSSNNGNTVIVKNSIIGNTITGSSFSEMQLTNSGSTYYGQKISDFDNDGKPDIGYVSQAYIPAIDGNGYVLAIYKNTFDTNPLIVNALPAMANRGDVISIIGEFFDQSVTGINIGGTDVPFTVVNPALITATIPVEIWNANIHLSSAKTSSDYYGVMLNIAPFISDISIVSGKPGDIVTITGKNLWGTGNVKFGPTSISPISVSNTQVVTKVPQNAGYSPVEVSMYNTITYNYLSARSSKNFSPVYPGSSSLSFANFSSPIGLNTNHVGITNFELSSFYNNQRPDLIPFYFDGGSNYFALIQNNTSVNSIDGSYFSEDYPAATSTSYPLLKFGQILNGPDLDAVMYDGSTQEIKINLGSPTNGISYYTYQSFNTGFINNFALGDFNNDGLNDIVVQASNYLIIYRNFNGSYFAPTDTINGLSGSWSNGMAVADLNNDNVPEIMGINGSGLQILNNTCTGNGSLDNCYIKNFYAYSSFGTNDLKIADLNNDLLPEIVISYPYSPTGSSFLQVLKNNSTANTIALTAIGGFNFSVPNGGTGQINVAIGDLNGDNKADIALSYPISSQNNLTLFQNNSPDAGNIGLANNGTMTFAGNNTKQIKINDLDGDWRPELILAFNTNTTTGAIQILHNLSPATEIYVPVDSIKVIPTTGLAQITALGDSLQLDVQVFPPNASDKTWNYYVNSPAGSNDPIITDNGKFYTVKDSITIKNGLYGLNVYSNAFGSSTSAYIEITVSGQNVYLGRISPASGVPGDIISISGNNFNKISGSNFVSIGGAQAEVISSSPFGMEVKIPNGVKFGPVLVTNDYVQESGLSLNSFFPTYYGGAPIDTSLIKKATSLNSQHANTMASADIDGDGFTDLVVLNDSSFTVFRNGDTLKFEGNNIPTSDFYNKYTLTCLHIQDFDKDGKPDIFIGAVDQYGYGNILIYYNNSSPKNIFPQISSDYISTNGVPVSLNSLDMDDDGYIDVVMLDQNGYFTTYSSNNDVYGGGKAMQNGFIEVNSVQINNIPSNIEIADLDGDGSEEVIISQRADTTMYTIPKNALLINQGKQPCTLCKDPNEATYIQLKYTSDLVRIADIDGDSYPDMLSLNMIFGNLSILRNTTGGTDSLSFLQAALLTFPGMPTNLEVGDINGDNMIDIAVTDTAGFVHIFQNNSLPGNISVNTLSRKSISTDLHPGYPVIVDLDNDQVPDLAVSNPRNSKIDLFKNLMPKGGIVTGIGVNSIDKTTLLSPNVTKLQMVATISTAGIGSVDTTVTWSTSNTLASISGSGLLALTTTLNGVVNVTATSVSNPNVSGSFVVTVIGKIKDAAISIVSNENLTIAGFKASPCYSTYELSIPTITGQSYQWYYNDLKLIGANSNTYKPVVNGHYYIIAIDSIAYKYQTYDVTLSGFSSPEITKIGDTLLTSSLVADYYQWYVDNIIIKNANSQSLRIWYNGNYSVTTKNNSDGCKLKSPDVNINNNGFRSIKDSDLVFGDSTIENYGPDLRSLDIKIYPNPSSGVFTIEATSIDDINSYQITDLTGRIIETGEIPKSGNKFSLLANKRSLDKGVYFVYVRNQSQKKCIKVVIE